MALFTTYRVQDSLPAIGSDNAAGNPRINNRAELVVVDSIDQAVQDGQAYQANNAAIETGTLSVTTFASGGTNPFIAMVVPSGTSMRPFEIGLTQDGTAAGNAFDVYVAYENADLVTSAGTGASINNMRTDDPSTSLVTCTTLPTVTAPSDDRGLFSGIFTQNVTDPKHSDDSWLWSARKSLSPILVGPATFLIYAWVTGTAPTLFFRIAWGEWKTSQVT